MFYLTTHSTHSIYGVSGYISDCRTGRKEGTKEGRKEREMFYLTTHSTHFIYGYMASEREREMFYLTTHSTHSIYGYMVSADRSATVRHEGKEGEREKCFI